MKIIFICTLVFGCTPKHFNKTDNTLISSKAEVYSNSYERNLLKSATLMVKQGSSIKEQFIINSTHGWVSHFSFSTPPYSQFVKILEEDRETPFYVAKEKLNFDLLNYSAKDCSTVKEVIETYNENPDLSSTQKSLPVKIDSPTYIYQFKSGIEGVEHKQIKVTIEAHPIVDFYHELKNAINQCPHPKTPKYNKI